MKLPPTTPRSSARQIVIGGGITFPIFFHEIGVASPHHPSKKDDALLR